MDNLTVQGVVWYSRDFQPYIGKSSNNVEVVGRILINY